MKFDLSKYSTVAERLAQFHLDHLDGRITTELLSPSDYEPAGKGARTWVIKASLFLTAGDQANNLPKATGYAFEIEGGSGANQTSSLENGESSSIGRALMVAGYSMNREPNTLASREEMQKVQRGPTRDYLVEASKLKTVEPLRLLWAEAKASGLDSDSLDRIKELANAVSSTGSVSGGTQGGLPGLSDKETSSAGSKPTNSTSVPRGRK
jgi:hypothetical protein